MLDFSFGDSFCGAGGTSRGATKAGGKSKFAYDLNYVQSEVYKANFGHCTNKSIQDVSVEEILALPDINMFCVSPPCQFWSRARNKNLPKRKDKDVGIDILPFIAIKKPEFVFLENVEDYAKSPVFKAICETLRELGYFVEFKICNMADWSVPQSRTRTIMLASNQGEFQFPFRNEKHIGWGEVVSAEAIARCQKVEFTNHQKARLPANLRPYSLLEREGARDDRNIQCRYFHEPSFTIKALGGDRHWRQADIWTGSQLYGVSVEVCRKLQTFPDEHLLPEDNVHAWYGIGNSVPPLFAEKLLSDFISLFA